MPNTETPDVMHETPSATTRDDGFTVHGRTVLLAIAFLVGGGATSGGVSLVSGSDQREALASLVAKIDSLGSKVDDMRSRALASEVAFTAAERRIDKMEARAEALEQRVRDLETKGRR
jgi:outer membrane murein-binding lipoprotein Lpp